MGAIVIQGKGKEQAMIDRLSDLPRAGMPPAEGTWPAGVRLPVRWRTHDGVADIDPPSFAQSPGKGTVSQILVCQRLSNAEQRWVDGGP
jgi:hypothetical protein